jgi:hypothetical protein
MHLRALRRDRSSLSSDMVVSIGGGFEKEDCEVRAFIPATRSNIL